MCVGAAGLTGAKAAALRRSPPPQEEEKEEKEERLFVFIGYCRGTQGARCYTDDASLKPDESGHDQWRGYRVYPPHCHDWGGVTSPTVYQWGG